MANATYFSVSPVQIWKPRWHTIYGADNPREAGKARVILRDLLGPIQMCPGPDGSLWAEFYVRPAALVKKAVGTGAGSDGSGGALYDLYAD